MTDRVRILDAVTGEVLHEGPRARSSPVVRRIVPHPFFYADEWTLESWIAELNRWEGLLGEKPPILFNDPTNLVCAIGSLDHGNGDEIARGIVSEQGTKHPFYGPIGRDKYEEYCTRYEACAVDVAVPHSSAEDLLLVARIYNVLRRCYWLK